MPKMLLQKKHIMLSAIAFVPLLQFLFLCGRIPVRPTGWIFVGIFCASILFIYIILTILHGIRIRKCQCNTSMVSFYLTYAVICAVVIYVSHSTFQAIRMARPGSQFAMLAIFFLPFYLIPTVVIFYYAGWFIEILFDALRGKMVWKNLKIFIGSLAILIGIVFSGWLFFISYSKSDENRPLVNIHYAAQKGNIQEITRFLNEGVNINLATDDQYQETPLHKAAFHGQIAVIKYLVDHGADPNATNAIGQTPLHKAVRGGELTAVQTLLTSGANINCQDRNGNTPMHEAVRKPQKEMVLFLINHGAELNRTNYGGQTPIFTPIWYNYKDITEILLQNGATLSFKDKKGRTPDSIAQEKGYHEIEELLKKYEHKID